MDEGDIFDDDATVGSEGSGNHSEVVGQEMSTIFKSLFVELRQEVWSSRGRDF